jgi:hypothetical protein
MPTEVLMKGRISRKRPQPDVDGGREGEPTRLGKYGDQMVVNLVSKKHALADEGSYMTASLAPGVTSLQLGLSAAFSATAAAVVLTNTDTPGKTDALRIYPDYIRMLVGTVPTSATALLFATVIDSKDRTPTTVVALNGTPATATAYTPAAVCVNMDENPPIVGKPFFPLSTAAGAPPAIPAAGSATRTIVGNGSLRTQIPVVGDEYWIDFGHSDVPSGQLVTAAPAGASRIVAGHPPIVLGPGQSLLLYLWAPSNATAGIAFTGMDIGWWER